MRRRSTPPTRWLTHPRPTEAACASASLPRARATTAASNSGRRLGEILDTLESFHGAQTAQSPGDPYLFLVWWHCGYPPSEARCGRGWQALERAVGVSPVNLLAAGAATLRRALAAGGMVPELRAERLRGIARRVRDEFGGDLRGALARMPAADAHRLLRSFPGVGPPGADRVLLFGELAPVAAVPSNCPHVVTRIESGSVPTPYTAAYARARRALEALPATFEARRRAYLLLRAHGQELCKSSKPRCGDCPVAARCAFAARRARRRRTGAAGR